MTLTSAEIAAWVGAFMWPFVRISALFLAAPVFGNILVPVRIRVLLGAALTFAVMPAVGDVPQVDPLSLTAVVIAGQQVLIGVAMGLMLAMAFQTVVIASETIALTMGLGFAMMVDPQNGASTPVLSQFLLVVVTLLFLAVGGHLILIQLIAESFTRLPIDAVGLTGGDYRRVVAWAAEMYGGAVLLALPAIAVLLTVNMIIGVMTRTAPQMNIFSVGFPITMMAGFLTVLMLLMPSLANRMTTLWRHAFDTLRQILGG